MNGADRERMLRRANGRANVGEALALPMARTDRIWRGRGVLIGMGPLEVPTHADMVAALVRLADAGPNARVGLRFDPRSDARWHFDRRDLADWFDSCVVRLPAGADDDVDALLTGLGAEPTCDRPLRVYLGDRHLFLRLDHALADGRLTTSLPTTLVSIARGGELPRWTTMPVERNPLRAALRATFPSSRSVQTVLGEWRSEQSARAALCRSAVVTGDGTRAFTPRPVTVNEFGPPGRMRLTQAWAREHAAGSAPFATVLSCVHQALAEHGVACVPGVHLLYDLRRYLPRGRHLSGNFAIGVDTPVHLADPARLSAAVVTATRAGRPLLSLSASAARVGMPAARVPAPPTRIATRPPAALAYSYVGAKKLDDTLPWTAPAGERHLWARGDPAGAAALTLFAALIDRRLTLTASFHGSVFDPDTVRAALRAVHADPVGLLTRSLRSVALTRPAATR